MRYIFILLSLVWLNAEAQDKIYYKKNKIDDWKVTEITPEYIKGMDARNPGISYSTTPSNVLFIFNHAGNFLVLPKLYDKDNNSAEYIKNFFQDIKNGFDEFDKIITTENNIIVCKFESQDDKNILYVVSGKQEKIPISDVAIIIFRNGEHRLFANADKTFKVLSSIQDLYFEQAFAPGQGVSQETEVVEKTAGNIDSLQPKKESRPDTAVVASTGTSNMENNNKETTELDSSTLIKLQTRALQNIKELGLYIQVICNKDTDPDEVAKTIDQVLALFINEDATVEVSSLHRSNVQRYKIRVYLNRMGLLKYDKVEVEWFNIQYTSKLRKGPDGFYYGIVEFEQRFTGISGDKNVYQDITRKSVEVILKTYEKKRGGQISLGWEVFLGDIGITVTKPA